MTLDDALEDIVVHDPGLWENELSPLLGHWYAVSNPDESIIAYFYKEADAYRFRLAEINRLLNG